MMVSIQPAHSRCLDLLRAVAMLYIVGFWHLDDYAMALHLKNSFTALLATCALGLFVFLSGMLLSQRYQMRSLSDTCRFYTRRFSRIYPMYMLTLLAFAATGLIWKRQALKGLLLLNTFTGTPLPTLWFVEVLLVFYLLTPSLLYNYQIKRTLLIAALISFSFGLASHCSNGAVDIRLAQYFLIFAFGVIAGRYQDTELALAKKRTVACSACVLAVLLCVEKQLTVGASVVVAQLEIVAFLPLAFSSARWASTWMNPTLTGRIAYASYAMYLLHRLTGRLVNTLYVPTSTLPSLLYFLLVWIPLTYVLAWAFQRSYDRLYGAVQRL